MVGCLRCTYPSIHFFVSRSWSLPDKHISKHSLFFIALKLWRSRSVARRGHIQAFARKTRADSQDHGRWTPCTCPSIHRKTRADSLDHGRLPAEHTSKHSPVSQWKALSRSRSVVRRATQACRQKSPCVDTIWGHRSSLLPDFFLKKIWESWAGHTERRQRTRETTGRHHTRDNGHVRQQRAECDLMMVEHWNDGVPVLHVQPVPARLRQLHDQAITLRPELQHAAMSDQNRALGQKADWQKKKKRGDFFITGIFPARELFSITVSY